MSKHEAHIVAEYGDLPPAPAVPSPGWCVECGEAWPCDATVRNMKDGIPHRAVFPARAALTHLGRALG